MKKVLIIDRPDNRQVFMVLNYLLCEHATVYTEVDHSFKYDCIVANESMILSEDSVHLEFSRKALRAPGATIISLYDGEYPSKNPKVFEYADIQEAIETFTTLYDRELEDIFCCMWNLPIQWRRIRESN